MIDDAKLIERSISGDGEAFGLLVRRYQSATYALALQRVRNPTAAEEIAQDVFVRAYQKLGQLKDPNRFGGWLRSIALRQCGMWARSEKRKPTTLPLVEEEVATDAPTGRQASRHDEPFLDIHSLIAQLPHALKAAAVLCLEDELSPSAAAAVLGLKPATLRKRLHDARVRLQRQIVEEAERQFRLHLLPKDFAERCVCRCEKSEQLKTREEVRTMAKKRTCGCGCTGTDKRQTKSAAKRKPKEKK